MAPKPNTPRHPRFEPIVNERSFVFSDGIHKASDGEVRRKIRANAMQDYWRRRKLGTKSVSDNRSMRSRSVTFEDSPCDLGDDEPATIWWRENGRPKLSSGSVEATVEPTDSSAATQTAHATHPQKGDPSKNEAMVLNRNSITDISFDIGNSMFDPFNASALDGSRHERIILSHFISITEETPKRKGFSKLWLPTAIQDPMLLRSTLTFATIWLDVLGLPYDGFRPLSYKAQTIDNLNKNLQSPKTALSNSTIATVALLANMAGYTGNYEELRMHGIALQKMIELRGGLESLGSFPGLQVLLAWLGLMFSNIVHDSLHDSPCIYMDDGAGSAHFYDGILPYPLSPRPDRGHLHELGRDLSAVFHDMRHLTLAIESESQQPGVKPLSYPKTDILDFDTMRKVLEYRLLRLKPDDVATDMRLADYPIELSRLAALIYLQYAVPMRTPDRQRIQSLRIQVIERLRRMEETYAVDAEDLESGVLLWARFVTAKIPWDDGEEAEEIWMIQRLARAVRAAGIATWTEMERRLRRVCWMELLHTPDCKRLWLNVQRINKSYWTESMLSMQQEWESFKDPPPS